MTTATGNLGAAGHPEARPLVRRDGEDGREAEVSIDLTASPPTRTLSVRQGRPSVLRTSPSLQAATRDLPLQAPPRHIHLGHDVESPLVWQHAAEAVRGLAPGDVAVLETLDLGPLPADLVDFLRHAVLCAARRGGTLRVEPPYGALGDVLQLAPNWPDFRRERSYR